jgi:hypothetical protein
MELIIEREKFKEILEEARNQFISVALGNKAGKWSDQYFTIEDVKEFKVAQSRITVLILTSSQDSRCVTIDINLLGKIKFNKYLNFNGTLAEEIKIASNNEVPLLSH